MPGKAGDRMPSASSQGTGWFRTHNAIVLEYGPQIGAFGLAVYSVIACHLGPDGRAWPSYGRIARLLGISRVTAFAAVKKLTELGLISAETRRVESGNLSNVYRLLDPPSRGSAGVPGGSAGVPGGSAESLPLVQQVNLQVYQVVQRKACPWYSRLTPLVQQVYPNKTQ